MTTLAFPLAAVALLLLAGCAAPSAQDLAAQDAKLPTVAPASPLPWVNTDCTYMLAFLKAPASRIQPYLPKDFTAIGSPMLPTGSLGIEIHDCRSVLGLDGPVASGYGALWVQVTPPKGAGDPASAGQDFFKWHVLMQDAPRRELLQAAGLPIVDGSAKVTPGPVPNAWSGRLMLDGVGAFAIDAAVPAPQRAVQDFPFEEFTNATGGFATWRASTSNGTSAQGAGTWQAPAGSVLANVMGATQGAATVELGHWSYKDGSIKWP